MADPVLLEGGGSDLLLRAKCAQILEATPTFWLNHANFDRYWDQLVVTTNPTQSNLSFFEQISSKAL